MKKKLLSIILCISLLLSIAITSAISVYASAQSDSAYDCVAYVRARFQEYFGFTLHWPNGNAKGYYYNAAANGDTVSNIPKAGALAVWKDTGNDSGPGHVAFVESVSGNSVYYSEGGYDGHYNAEWRDLSNMNKYYKNGVQFQTFLGFVYVKGSVNPPTSYWYDSLPLANIGNDVYAILLKNDGWVDLANVNDNVEIARESQDSSIMWHFLRQSDGSYEIYNCKNDKLLDVANAGKTAGTNVQVCTYNGSDAQKWYIYGRWSGEYVFRPKLCDKVLDVSNNGNSEGTNVQIWDYNGSNAQKFAIYPYEKSGRSVLSVEVGDSATETKFTWTKASAAQEYLISIAKDSGSGSRYIYKQFWTEDTSYSVTLPAGHYYADIETRNFFSWGESSNQVDFYIKECDHIHDFSSKVSINDDEHQLICSICGYTKTESHNNVNGVCDVCGKSIYYDYIVLDDGTIEITKNKAYKRTVVIIPSSIENKPVTSIGNSSFMTYNSSYVKKVVIPDTVTKIGECAFDYCYELTDITMPNSVTEIGDDAFSTDTSLESITLPNSIKTIGNNAFGSCSCLKNVVIPESVTSIGDRAFAGDDNLTSVTIYSNNASIGEKAFGYIHNSNGNIDKMEGFTITGYKGSTAEVYAKENGFTFIPLDITYNLGDVSDDGEVSIDDVTLIQKYLADVSSFTDTQKTFADVNGDGDVMIDDVTMIQKYLAGIITKLG